MIDFTLSQNDHQTNDSINNLMTKYGITETQHNLIYTFLTNPEEFYNKYCPSLVKYAIREKRFLDFETPNRVQITHEYDIKLPTKFNFNQYYYLFNPHNRLGWLKIRQGNNRITIAKSNDVRKIVIKALIHDLRYFENPTEIMKEIWKNKKGLPCFVMLKYSQEYEFILSSSYYESITQSDHSRHNKICSFFYPIQKHRIKYPYYPLERSSSWLYIKAPEHFIVKYYGENFKNNNSIEKNHKTKDNEQDPEKISLTIINKSNPSMDIPVIIFGIEVPYSLKSWYTTIYYLSLFIMFLTIGSSLNRIFLKYNDPIIYTSFNPDMLYYDKGGIIFTVIIAAIITTRGWMVHEETILKKFTILESCILLFTIIFYIIGIFC